MNSTDAIIARQRDTIDELKEQVCQLKKRSQLRGRAQRTRQINAATCLFIIFSKIFRRQQNEN